MHNLHTLTNHLENIKQQIAAVTNRTSPQIPVELIAVSKTFPSKSIRQLYHCGHREFAENHALELHQKALELHDLEINWHYIGKLQSNKIKHIAPFVSWIHSVEKISQVSKISQSVMVHQSASPLYTRMINSLIQINISEDPTRSGVDINDLDYIIELGKYIDQQPNMIFRGLMGIASNTSDNEIINTEFKQLNNLFLQLKSTEFNNIDSLSMGMSSDFEIAILNGATHVRIGSKLFGNRYYAK